MSKLSSRKALLKRVDLLRVLRCLYAKDFKLGFNLCPLHDDNNPSLLVTRFDSMYYYKCYSGRCGAQGNAFDLLNHVGYTTYERQVSFLLANQCVVGELSDKDTEALKTLADKDTDVQKDFQLLYEVCQNDYRACVTDPISISLVNWVESKFLANKNPTLWAPLDLGLFNRDAIMKDTRITPNFYKTLNVALDKLNKKYERCVIYFLRSSPFHFSGFCLRPAESTSKESLQFNLPKARGFGGLQLMDYLGSRQEDLETIAVEGFADMTCLQCAMHEKYGRFINCISVNGTSGFNNTPALEALEDIVAHTNNSLVIWPDNDEAGIASLEAINRRCYSLNIKLKMLYPRGYGEGQDPCDYVRGFNDVGSILNKELAEVLSEGVCSVPGFFYIIASEKIIRSNLKEEDWEEIHGIFIEVASRAKLTHSDLETYCEYVVHGMKDHAGELRYFTQPKVSKDALIADISKSVDEGREIHFGNEIYTIGGDSISRVQIKEDASGNERRMVEQLTNWSQRIRKVIVADRDGEKYLRYISDFYHEDHSKSKYNQEVTSDDYEPRSYMKRVNMIFGGLDVVFPTKSELQQRVRDICLRSWPDTIISTARDRYGYHVVDGEIMYVLDSHVITADRIYPNQEVSLDLPEALRVFGFVDEPVVDRLRLRESIEYMFGIFDNAFGEGNEHHMYVPFCIALLAPCWYFFKDAKRFTHYMIGEFRTGKTSAQRLARALFYKHGMDTGLTHNSTTNFLEAILSKYNDCPVVIDDYKQEVTGAGNLVGLLQGIYDNVGRGRMDKNLSVRQSNTSRCSVFMNGEDFPQIAQGSVYDRVLLHKIDGCCFNYGCVKDTMQDMTLYAKYQGWVAKFVQHIIKYGPIQEQWEFLNGKSRASRHAQLVYSAARTFIRFAQMEAGFGEDDPILDKFNTKLSSYLKKLVSYTSTKVDSETKWNIFRRNFEQLIKARRVTFTNQNGSNVIGVGSCIGEYLPANGVRPALMNIYPTLALAILRREMGINLTEAAVFASMANEPDVLCKVGEVESTEKNNWIIAADKVIPDHDAVLKD